MSEVTQILDAMAGGDAHAGDRLLPLVYEQLRELAAQRLAHEPAGQTLQPTALVHEAYLRRVVDRGSGQSSRPVAHVGIPAMGLRAGVASLRSGQDRAKWAAVAWASGRCIKRWQRKSEI
jgi:hypothetical protein